MSENIDALAVIRGMADPANEFHAEAISAIAELIGAASLYLDESQDGYLFGGAAERLNNALARALGEA